VSRHDAFMALVDSAVDADVSTSRRHRHRTLCHLELNEAGDWIGRAHLGPVLDPLIRNTVGRYGELDEEQRAMLALTQTKPSLFCAYGEADRIVLTGLDPADDDFFYITEPQKTIDVEVKVVGPNPAEIGL